ncbi:MAG: glycosyltransferase, partial [Candidatus Jacksonbacteria bacterium]|nr:glycosyltransferase [Candidatus Jacksonbacteria bacterium]
MSAKLNKDLTIVIPAKNEEHFIGRLLDSLLAQDYSHIKRTHIVVADAASVDNTRRVIKSYSERLCISIVEGG